MNKFENQLSRTASHPLDRLSEAETASAVEIIKADSRFLATMRFVSVDLHAPDKEAVSGFIAGSAVHRMADAILLNPDDGSTIEATASLNEVTVTHWHVLHGVQPAIIFDEFLEAEAAIKKDEGFRQAMARRGITNLDLVNIDPWSTGNFGDPLEQSHRVIRGLVWVNEKPGDNQFARPVDGLMVLVDVATGKVLRIDDEHVYPVPPESSEWSRKFVDETRSGVKPLQIIQNSGPSFTVDGDHLSWQKWDLRVGWTAREGLVINTVTYTEGDDVRPILYRASLAEMTVPYGDPSPTQARKNAFDVGEYGLGMLANSLKLGCDCLGEIHYLDAHVCNAAGNIVRIPQAICIHEEDTGIAWKHTDFRTEQVEVRRMRRLVVSFICTVGNYEYGIYWHFYQDGRIENEIKLTGILSTAGMDDDVSPRYGQALAPNLYAPNHQHFFCVRLDMQVDGSNNTVKEIDTVQAPTAENPFGNAFAGQQTVLKTEQQAQCRINPLTGRYWKICSTQRTNIMGEATGYKLIAGENVLPFATDDSSIRKRAGYMWNHLWVTPYRRDENWPAGTYPNQSTGGEGLPKWVEQDRRLEDEDLVVWYVMGHNHLPSLEDWPVMPVASISFTLKPSGFFNRSPAMDLPASDRCNT